MATEQDSDINSVQRVVAYLSSAVQCTHINKKEIALSTYGKNEGQMAVDSFNCHNSELLVRVLEQV